MQIGCYLQVKVTLRAYIISLKKNIFCIFGTNDLYIYIYILFFLIDFFFFCNQTQCDGTCNMIINLHAQQKYWMALFKVKVTLMVQNVTECLLVIYFLYQYH